MRIESGRERAGWRRGNGALILMLLIGVALVLVLMFGNFGGKSYMQNVAGAKKKGNETGVDVLAYSLVQMITAARATNPDAVPTSFEDLGAAESAYIDPWGKPIRWEYDDAKHPKSVRVISDGPDGQPGTGDEVVVEKPLPL